RLNSYQHNHSSFQLPSLSHERVWRPLFSRSRRSHVSPWQRLVDRLLECGSLTRPKDEVHITYSSWDKNRYGRRFYRGPSEFLAATARPSSGGCQLNSLTCKSDTADAVQFQRETRRGCVQHPRKMPW